MVRRAKGTKDQEEVEQCIIDLMDSGEIDDEDDARAICEEIYGEEAMDDQHKRTPGKVEYRTVASDKTKGLDFVLSDATPDRYDDIILTAGWKLENFVKNPIALFAHAGSFPIGSWKNVRVEENALRGTLVLAKEGTSDRIDEIRKLVDADILKAVSVGFTPISYEERKGDTYGLVYTEQELVECSLVSVPANPNALLLAKQLKISEDTRKLVFGKKVFGKKASATILSRKAYFSKLGQAETRQRSLVWEMDQLTRSRVPVNDPRYQELDRRAKAERIAIGNIRKILGY